MAVAEQRRNWCWYAARGNTPGDVSVLAMVETILAMAFTVACGVWLNRWGYVLLASLVAPLLLLRTEASVRLGFTLFQPPVEWAGRKLPTARPLRSRPSFPGAIVNVMIVTLWVLWSVTLHALYYLFVLLWSFSVKAAATMWTTFRHPFQSLSAIPTNWSDVCLITDSTRGLELIPGLSVFPHGPLILEVLSDPTAQMRMSFASVFRILVPNPRPRDRSAQPDLIPRDWLKRHIGQVGGNLGLGLGVQADHDIAAG